MRVEALIDEELPPRGGAVRIQSFIARHLQLRAEKEAGMRVDEQQRTPVPRVRRCDGKPVRSLGLPEYQTALGLSQRYRPLIVEGLQLCERHAFDIAADAALRKAQGHPRFEVCQYARMHVWMRGKIVVQAARPRLHQLLQPDGAAGIVGSQRLGIDEQPL